jgi:tRNA-2-methylthio-N6-dimethylallyladenosine synthase
MTSHPKDASDALFDAIRDCGHVAKHLHLPVQSGSNAVLAAMNRGYTRQHYLGLIDALRARVPDVNLTSDVIVGFPGETESDFEDTLDLLRRVRFDSLFTFLYSKRGGTPAADLPDPTPPEVKKQRFQRLLDLQKQLSETNR